MENIWQDLYNKAKSKLNPRELSPFVSAGGVACAIETEKGNIYTGVCIDTACSLGMCAERNAVANMITNGENRVKRLVCIMSDGSVGYPCGACRELLMQLDINSPDIEILTDLESLSVTKLSELMPNWWGNERMTT